MKVPCALENVYSAIVGWSINIGQVKLVDNTLQVTYILTDFLSIQSINYRESSVDISSCNCEF